MDNLVLEFIFELGAILIVPLICLGGGLLIMLLAVMKENSHPQKQRQKFTLDRQKEIE